jgi:hypothetical protein
MCGLWMHELKVPEVVVSCLSLRDLVMRLGLSSVDDIRELYGILYEKHRNLGVD